MKAEPSRLIRLTPIDNVDLFIVYETFVMYLVYFCRRFYFRSNYLLYCKA